MSESVKFLLGLSRSLSLSALDRRFGLLVERLAGNGVEAPLLALAAALTSREAGGGGVCLDLAAALEQLRGKVIGGEPPSPEAWAATIGLHREVVSTGEDPPRPLVLNGTRLYLHRFWEDEGRVAAELLARAGTMMGLTDETALGPALKRLFGPAPSPGEEDRPRLAAAMAALRGLTVISGGPGTGKTTALAKILAVIQELAGGSLRMALAAPTGKAAARLQEVVGAAFGKLDLSPAVRESLPQKSATVQRLLGMRRDGTFTRTEQNRLDLDLLAVDEASMVDLPLMARLLAALPPTARLVLLGDKDQLASVEAGHVLGDLCSGAGGMTPIFRARLAQVTGLELNGFPEATLPLADAVLLLTRNWRFEAGSRIGELSRLVNEGRGREARLLLEAGDASVRLRNTGRPRELSRELAEQYHPWLEQVRRAGEPQAAIEGLEAFRVLTARREGRFGSDELNPAIEQNLEDAGLIPASRPHYIGRPVMIAVNDYGLKLYNGDTGVILRDPEAEGHLAAFFPGPDLGGVRRIPLARLPAHRTAFSLTVHKAQGSEFGRVALVLAGEETQVMTRELLYTGLTRAREGVEIRGTGSAFEAACGRVTRRSSGLRERLWGSPSPGPLPRERGRG